MVNNCPMPRHSQEPTNLEPLTRRSGSQLEFTAHPLLEMRLRKHFGLVELQVVPARATNPKCFRNRISSNRCDYESTLGWSNFRLSPRGRRVGTLRKAPHLSPRQPDYGRGI